MITSRDQSSEPGMPAVAVPAGRAPARDAGTALALLVLVYAALAAALSPAIYFQLLPVYGLQTLLAVPLLLGVALPLGCLSKNPAAPVSEAIALLRRSAGILPRSAATIALFILGMAAFTTFKLSIPHLVPFYADAVLADIDAALHGGDPWIWAHAILPEPFAWGLAYIYSKIWMVYWFATILVMAFWHERHLRLRYLWTMALAIVGLGTLLAAALSSVGPVFSAELVGSDRFVPLEKALAGPVGDAVAGYRDYLLAAYYGFSGQAGSGISAMPSMHVAVVTCNALVLGSINRWLGAAAWAFAGIILFGSVYLSWHYAIDGYVSIIIVLLIWTITGRVLRPSSQQDQS